MKEASKAMLAPPPQAHAVLRDGMECSMCRYVVQTVKSDVDDPVTLEHIKEAALKVSLGHRVLVVRAGHFGV